MPITDRISRLSGRERDYLRLVYQACSSKEIARIHRVEPGTVDKALKSAMAKLGTSSRREAARMLAETDTQKLAPQAQPIEAPADPAILSRFDENTGWQPRRLEADILREEQVPYRADPTLRQGLRLPLPRYRGERNDLTLKERLLWIFIIAVGVVVMASALVAIAFGGVRLAVHLLRLQT